MRKVIQNVGELSKKAMLHTVREIAPLVYAVTSGSSGDTYRVEVHQSGATCTCPWGHYRDASDKRSACSHVQAVYQRISDELGQRMIAVKDYGQARRLQRPSKSIGDGVLLVKA